MNGNDKERIFLYAIEPYISGYVAIHNIIVIQYSVMKS